MALLFDATTERLESTDNALIPTTGSMSFWLYPNWAQGDGANHIFLDEFTDANNQTRLQKFSDNNLYFGFLTAGVWARITVLNANYTLNQSAWNHVSFTWDDVTNDQRLYLNGTEIGSNSTNDMHVSQDLALGNQTTANGGAVNMDGRLAEWAIWNVVLTSGQAAILSRRIGVPRVRQDALTNHWPIYGTGSPEPNYRGTSALTVTGATVADHAPVQPSWGFDLGWTGAFTAAVPAAGQPMMKRWGGVPFMRQRPSAGGGIW